MTPTKLKADLDRDGFKLSEGNGKLIVSPGAKLTPQLRAAIGLHRDALLSLIRGVPVAEPAPVQAPGELAEPDQVKRLMTSSKLLGLDLETTGLNPRTDRIRLLSVSDGRQHLVMDCFRHDVRQVLPWLADKYLVAHNASFDLGFLWHAGLTDLPETLCTYLLAQLVTAGDGGHGFPELNLKACVRRWLNVELPKELQASDWSGTLSEAQIDYARRDAAVLLPLLNVLIEQLEAGRLVKVSDIELRALPAFVWMAQAGLPFDRKAWWNLANEAAAKKATIESRLDATAPKRGSANLWGGHDAWNWSSTKQVEEVLAELGFQVATTNDAQLAEINHPVAALIREHREWAKKLSTYGLDWLEHVAGDDRVYPGWRQIGAASGRTSCHGPNMQQIPRAGPYRQCIKAGPGRTLVKADYSQLQLRIGAKWSRDAAMLKAYKSGEDLHTATARALTGKKEPTKADRQIAKSANFGLLFGMAAPGLRIYAKTTYGVEFTEAEAEQHRNTFFRTYHGLAKWHAETRHAHVKETRTAAGRRRLLPVNAPDTWRLNSPVQGDEADGAKLAMALLWERRTQCPDARPVIFNHDEIVVECPAERAEPAKAWLTAAMIDGMRPWLEPVPVEVEARIVATWGG